LVFAITKFDEFGGQVNWEKLEKNKLWIEKSKEIFDIINKANILPNGVQREINAVAATHVAFYYTRSETYSKRPLTEDLVREIFEESVNISSGLQRKG
jgi:hypothetical protein